MNKLNINVNVNEESAALQPYWSYCVGAGRAAEGLRAAWLEQLALVKKECGFHYCRFHGLFHDDMFVYREVDGQPVYNWQYIDELFDRMLDIGVRPFVELGFCPGDLASGDATQFWWKARVSPPKDYARWGELVERFVRHCVERYGLEEVRQWYFEVWNEANLGAFWDGTRAQYFELYKISAQAVKAVDSSLRVGGPATSNFVGDARFDGEREDRNEQITLKVEDLDSLEWRGVWIDAFLEYCEKQHLPVDFVSTHPYPTDFAFNPETGRNSGRTRKVEATHEDMAWLRKRVDESAFSNAEIHLTEWSSSPWSRDATHDSLVEAAYILKVNLDSIGLADSLVWWVFTDVFEEGGAGNTVFHGGFGLINYQGIVKPSFHAYRMLNMLGDQLLHREDGVVVTRQSGSEKTVALLYHYPSEMHTAPPLGGQDVARQNLETGSPKTFHIQLAGLKPGTVFNVETLDRTYGNALAHWQQMGAPEPPDRAQTEQLRRQAAELKQDTVAVGEDGVLDFCREFQPWEVAVIHSGAKQG